jgi:hypothetical protein
MKIVLRRCILILALAAGTGLLPGTNLRELSACPSCKNANETDARRPRAYMYSILFMLGMPATVLTGFGIAFYRMSRREMLDQVSHTQQTADGTVDGVAPGDQKSEG